MNDKSIVCKKISNITRWQMKEDRIWYEMIQAIDEEDFVSSN